MKLTLTDGANFINLEVDSDQLIEDVKALIEVEVHMKPSRRRYPVGRYSSTSRANFSRIRRRYPVGE
jgi:hypothetical protein